MFGLGMPEILLILAIALMVIGPKKLPELAKTLGRAMGEFKNAAQDFKRSIDLESSTREFTQPVRNMADDLKSATDPLKQDDGGKKETSQASGKRDASQHTVKGEAHASADADFGEIPRNADTGEGYAASSQSNHREAGEKA